jgi:hypothetical protein
MRSRRVGTFDGAVLLGRLLQSHVPPEAPEAPEVPEAEGAAAAVESGHTQEYRRRCEFRHKQEIVGQDY